MKTTPKVSLMQKKNKYRNSFEEMTVRTISNQTMCSLFQFQPNNVRPDFKSSVVYFSWKFFLCFCELLWFNFSRKVLLFKLELIQVKKMSIGRVVQKTTKNFEFFHLDKLLLEI